MTSPKACLKILNMQVMMNLSMAFSLLDAAEGAPDLTTKCQFKYVPKKPIKFKN
jgi:hypothetical protein